MIKMFFKKYGLELIVVFVAALIPLLWFQGTMITGTDVDFPLYPIERLKERTFVWYPHALGGSDRSNNIASLPIVALEAGASALGFSALNAERITYALRFLATGLGMYFLLFVLIGGRSPGQRLARVSGTLIYMVNFYQMFVWVRLQTSLSALAVLPVIIGTLIAVERKKIRLAYAALLLAIVAVGNGAIGIQPPHIYIFAIAIVVYLVIRALYHARHRAWKTLGAEMGQAGVLLGTFAASSLFWVIPLIHFITGAGYTDKATGASVYAVSSLLAWVSSTTTFLNLFRLQGDVSWFDSWGGQSYLPEFTIYQHSAPFIIASIVLPLLVAVFWLFRKRTIDPVTSFFLLVIIVVSLFFSKGTHAPAGNVYQWFIDRVPFFWIQRAPWQKFGILTILAYAVLGGATLGMLLDGLLERLSERKKIMSRTARMVLIGVVFVVMAGGIVWFNRVFVSGTMFPFGNGGSGYHQHFRLGFHNAFPEYIFAARNWIEGQKDYFKIYLLPDDKTHVYDWGFAGSADVTNLIFHKATLARQYGEGFAPPHSVERVMEFFVKGLYTGVPRQTVPVLRLLGVKYVLQRNDFRFDFYGDTDSSQFMKTRLALQKGLSLAKQFGSWDFYAVENPYPMAYVPDRIIMTPKEASDISPVLPQLESLPGSVRAAVFVGQQLREPQRDALTKLGSSASVKEASYVRPVSTRYEIMVQGVTQPFVLVVNENFESYWKLYGMRGEGNLFDTWFQNAWPEDHHVFANAYANGWLIDGAQWCQSQPGCQKNDDGSYDMRFVVEFWPQRLIFLGFGLTAGVLVIVGALAVRSYRRSRT